jgi:hypothetical protein
MPQTGVIGCQFHPGTGVKTLASQLLDTEKGSMIDVSIDWVEISSSSNVG